MIKHYNEKTPFGGASWDMAFFDDNHRLVDELEATWWEVHEYDEKGVLLRSHFGFFKDKIKNPGE